MFSPLILTCFIISLLCVTVNMVAEYSRDLMMMQQNSYRNERYRRWLKSSGDTTSYSRLIGLCVALLSLVDFGSELWGMGLMAVFAAGNAFSLLTRKYKKPLVWTNRVKRIFSTMIVLSVLAEGAVAAVVCATSGAGAVMFALAVGATFLYCGSHIIVMGAVALLGPVEKAINRKYYNEAAEILRSIPDLKVIGVTGSYGKTSTKHYLERILSEHFDVLMTPGSFNTTLGVIRTVREMMKPYTEVFICEMGAKQLHDIEEICDLVHPQIGIVTAVGPQHLESFKTIENVQRTKFELVDSLPADGLAVVNNDFPMIAGRRVDNTVCLRYGVAASEGLDFKAVDVSYTPQGTTFAVVGNGVRLDLRTSLVGECNVSNLVAAVVVAMHLGVPEDKIRYAVEKIEQVEHRLNMKRTPAGINIIDDAYNSNPTGSAMALDVLASMTPGRRFVITPGMIELGEKQYELNRSFGEKIGRSVDVAIVVGDYNKEAILEGIGNAGNPDLEVLTAATFAEAQSMMVARAKAGDTVLYENDLPDTFK
ncbi:MAG: UDP-N-acetylmuramoyl-tripeptide--D-alanyl-D-alanine ligase [Paramuribaculum sp.]|nr:UDP-N-acetylmuramoyl-tripeptide--D-alanyl-D-alanine ligase [Paramuribaculum sp.]